MNIREEKLCRVASVDTQRRYATSLDPALGVQVYAWMTHKFREGKQGNGDVLDSIRLYATKGTKQKKATVSYSNRCVESGGTNLSQHSGHKILKFLMNPCQTRIKLIHRNSSTSTPLSYTPKENQMYDNMPLSTQHQAKYITVPVFESR
jgi:hypothetical protein